MQLVTVAMDGNCFYRSLADQLYGSPSYYRIIKKGIIRFMRENISHYASFCTDACGISERLRLMELDGEWAGDLEVHAAL